MERILDAILNPYVGVTLAVLVLLAMVFSHSRKMALIRTGLIKKPAATRAWRIDYEKLRGGLWMIAVGGVIAAALHFEHLSGWVAFWLLVALLGVGQVLASLFGRDRWIKGSFSRHVHK